MCRSERGFSVVLVAVLLLLISIYSSVGMKLISARSEALTGIQQSEQALYFAEAGLNFATFQLSNDSLLWNDPAAFPETSFGSGSFDINIDPIYANPSDEVPSELLLTSQGREGEATRFVQARIQLGSGAVNHVIYSTGEVEVESDNMVVGSIKRHASLFPNINEAQLTSLARANTQNGYQNRADGNYFQGGFPEDQAPESLHGVIFIDVAPDGTPANVELSGLLSNFDPEAAPAVLVVKGDLNVTGDTKFRGLLIAMNGTTLNIEHGTGIYGAVLTTNQHVYLSNAGHAFYGKDDAFNDLTRSFLEGADPAQIMAWKEHYQE